MDLLQISLFTIIVLVLGITGLVIINEKYKASLAIGIVLTNAILTSIPSILALAGEIQTALFYLPHLPGKIIELRIDRLSAWFILIINFTSVNGVIYGSGYLKAYRHLKTNIELHWVFYVLFHISMIWVCIFEHAIMFLISWELMSLTSLMLVIFEYQKKDILKAGLNYMVQMHLSVAFLTAGFIWLFVETGSFNLSSLSLATSISHSTWIFVIFFIGFAIKAGFIPFHTWLPHAHPAAPSHVSGVMSSVIVKLGIFGILRIVTYINHDWLIIGKVILSLSVVTAIYGIVNAAVKYDFKSSLAFCTIENIGIIGIGIGIGLIGIGVQNSMLVILGFSGALLHTLNHSLFKSLLFFSAGNVYQQTHTRNIEKLGGLIKSMPVTAMFFLIGALAIGGLPPFNGFISEYLIYFGLFKGLMSLKGISLIILVVLSIAGLVIVGGISLLAFTKLYGTIFLGNPRFQFEHEPCETPFIMHLSQYFIIAAMLSVAICPNFYFFQVFKIVESMFGSQTVLNIPLLIASSESLVTIGRVSLCFIVLIIILYSVRFLLAGRRPTKKDQTWGCGYVAPIAKAQYTGRSYSRTFGTLFGFVVPEFKRQNKTSKSKLYLDTQKFSSYYFDLLEKYLVMPITKRISFVMNYFKFIQNGNIQSYVIYGLFFILLIFIGTALGIIF